MSKIIPNVFMNSNRTAQTKHKSGFARVTILSIVFAVGVGIQFNAAWSQSGPVIQVSPDRSMTIRHMTSANCDPIMEIGITGNAESQFRQPATGEAAVNAMVRRAAGLLRVRCPSVRQINARGYVGNQQVYAGLTTAGERWSLVEKSRRTSDFGDSTKSDGNVGAKGAFARAGSFERSDRLVARMATTQVMCIEPNNNTCRSIIRISEAGSSGGKLTINSMAQRGYVTSATFDFANEGGFACYSPRGGAVSVNGAQADMIASIGNSAKADLAAGPPQVCVGHQTTGGNIVQGSFLADGSMNGQLRRGTLVSGTPGLRFE